DAPSPEAGEAPAATNEAGKQVYTPADFARFAPRTAYDMLVQVPSFTLRQADQERGLGQASENVLINGQRIANKSGGAIDELQRVSAANVARIEIVDASTLGIAGLSGQVANVILTEQRTSSGQFEWEPNFRAHFAEPNLLQGLISYSSATGPIDYTLSIQNNTGRGGFGGPIAITDPLGNLAERRSEVFHSEAELPTIQAKFG
ncbi:MAG: Plug domain-containing protein, partial [Sphingobium sp.]|nr:Plug domain-containing protein [Sphingobium sp.]